jgi:CelD/BcsL family acetyltransferase involved in cellulose biosynthesis
MVLLFALALLSPEDRAWRTFAVEHATSPLQHPSWVDLLTGAYGLKARVWALIDPSGTIVAGLPMIRTKLPWRQRWTSLPYTDMLDALHVERTHREELLLALAGLNEPILMRSQADVEGWVSREVGTAQVIALAAGPDEVLRSASAATRKNLKRAQRPSSGLRARPITSREEFLRVALDLMARSRSRLGAPTQPRSYWSGLWGLHERGEALTIGVYHEGKLAATAVFMVGRSHAVFKHSASDLATRDLRTNYLAFATALEHLAALGLRSLDFGITDIRNTSLRRYKTQWGGEEQPVRFSATDAGMLPDTLEPGRLVTAVLQRSPSFVGRAVGSLAYPFVA